MKKTVLICSALMSLLFGCSGNQGDFDFTISPDQAQIIKAQAVSCVSYRNSLTSGDPAVADVPMSYARFANVAFQFPSTDKALNIQGIDVKFVGITGASNITIAGDPLFAMNTVWYDNGEAIVGGPANRKSYKKPTQTYNPATIVKMDCALILGSLPQGAAYQGSVTLTAYGYTEDAAGNQEFAQAQAFVTVIYRGDL